MCRLLACSLAQALATAVASFTGGLPALVATALNTCRPWLSLKVVHLGPEGREEKEAFFKPLREFGPVEVSMSMGAAGTGKPSLGSLK